MILLQSTGQVFSFPKFCNPNFSDSTDELSLQNIIEHLLSYLLHWNPTASSLFLSFFLSFSLSLSLCLLFRGSFSLLTVAPPTWLLFCINSNNQVFGLSLSSSLCWVKRSSLLKRKSDIVLCRSQAEKLVPFV